VLDRLERDHEVLAITLPGHAGGPPLPEPFTSDAMIDAVEQQIDRERFDGAHIAGNSLGGYIALHLATRRRARTVTAFAPAGGWAQTDSSWHEMLDYQATMLAESAAAAPYADELAATATGRRNLTQTITTNYEHIPAELLADQLRAAAGCSGAEVMFANARANPWELDAERVDCPVRIVWGTADQLLPWPTAAARYRTDWLPAAEYIELEGIGHCPQLDVPLETAELITGHTNRVSIAANR
jgi:pimeloyl-ACP methyl ester carboxylesterase